MLEPTAGEIACQRLREALRSGRYVPQQRLIEPDVMAELDVTRLALREAFARLEHEGLVQRQANRGATVRLLSLDEATEVLEIRSVVEGLGARHAAALATDDDIAALWRSIERFESALAEPDIAACNTAQAELHHLVTDISARPTVARLTDMLSAQSAQTRMTTARVSGRLRQSLEEHRAIVEAIAGRDQDAAEAKMRRHINGVIEAASESM